MGRKSSEKKKRRIEQQKDHHSKPPVKQEKKKLLSKLWSREKKEEEIALPVEHPSSKESPQEPTKEKPKRKIPTQKIFGALFAAIMLTILVYVGIMLFQKTFAPTSLAELLPDSETVALIEVNTNTEHTQLTKAQKLLSQTKYSLNETLTTLNKILNIDIKKDIFPWLGRQIGVAELTADEDGVALSSAYFLEVVDQKLAENFLQKLAENNLSKLETINKRNNPIYTFTLRHQGEDRSLDTVFFATFLEDYLIFSPSQKAITLLINTQSNSETLVSENEKYNEIKDKLPQSRVAFVFINFKHQVNALLQKYGLFTNSSFLTYAIKPFSTLFNSEGAALIAKDDSFAVESFMAPDSSYLNENYLSYKEKYNANLADYVPSRIDAFWGGMDLSKQIKRLVTIVGGGENTDLKVFEDVIQNYVEKYFGKTILLEEDIYPLIKNEFAITYSKNDKKDIYTLILDLANPAEDAVRLKKIANNFISTGAFFEPHVEEHKLPDGTVAKEIIATPEELMKSESSYKDTVIYEMKTEGDKIGFYYAIFSSKAIISTDKDTLIESLKLTLNESLDSLKNSKIYKIHIDSALENTDEVSYFDISKFWPDSKLIKSISTGKEYFEEGLMAYYYIHVE
jgi:hypothetical protein